MAENRKDAIERDRERFLKKYTGLVYKVVLGYRGGVSDPEDLAQEGFIALLRARESFDPDGGAAFSTYAYRGIFMAVHSYARKQLRHHMAMMPAMEITERGTRRHARAMVSSMDDEVPSQIDNDVVTLHERIASESPSPEALIQQRETFAELADTMRIAVIRCGNDHVGDYNFVLSEIASNKLSPVPKADRTIGKRVGLSRQRIVQLGQELIKKARLVSP